MLLDYLAQVIKDHSYTIYSLAVSAGIERSYLSKILSGKRNMTTDIFQRILYSIPLADEERRQLSELFIAESFGKENFDTYLSVFKLIGDLSSVRNDDDESFRIIIKADDEIHRLESEQEFFTVANGIISGELESDKPSKRIYTNVSSVRMIEIMKKYPNRPDVDFRQIVCLDNAQSHPAKIFSEALCIMMLGYSTHYYTANTKPVNHSDNLFPHFLITDNFCLFADSDYSKGYRLRNPAMADIYAEKFTESLRDTGRYITSTNDIMQSRDFHLSILKNSLDHFYTLGSNICLCPHLTLDMWHQVAKPDIPNREFLIDTCYESYKLYSANINNRTVICTHDAVNRFLETGIITQMPEEYTYPLSKENRISTLIAFRKVFEGENCDFRILKPDVLANGYDFEAEFFDRLDSDGFAAVTIALKDPNAPMKFCGNSSFNIFDRSTSEDFISFVKHLVSSDLCYSKETSLGLLDEAIQKAAYLFR